MKVIYQHGYNPDVEYEFISVVAMPDPSNEYKLKVRRGYVIEELPFTHIYPRGGSLVATLPENY